MNYELQVWDKLSRKFVTTWKGNNLNRAQIMAKKPYNNYDWMGKKRILSISIQVIEVK